MTEITWGWTSLFKLAKDKNGRVSVWQEKWRHLVEEGTTTIELFDHVTLMTLDSLLKCAFSYDSNCQRWARPRRHVPASPLLLISSSISSPSSRSSSEYVSAIVELSDLIIARRQKILHHWDWIYWRTQEGKRFRKALNIVHGYMIA